MTLQALPTQPEVWRPDESFWLACVRTDTSDEHALRVAEEACDEFWAEEYWPECDRLMLLQIPTKPPMERLARYQLKPVQELPPVPPLPMTDAKGQVQLVEQAQPLKTGSWFTQKTDWPNDFEHDMEDWVKLEPVSLRRDAVWREIATLELMAAGQGAMASPPEALPQAPAFGNPDELPALPWQAQQQAPQ